MLPLDVTTPHELPFRVYRDVVDPTFVDASSPSKSTMHSPLVHFTSSFLERTREIMLKFGKDSMELHDIVAVWCAIDNPPFLDHEEMTFADGWKAHARIFDIERYIPYYHRVPWLLTIVLLTRTGELTRGMLVVDRREDVSAYPLGTIRSEAQREPHEGHGDVTIGKPDGVDVLAGGVPGVVCMYETPGPAEILKLLLERVWGSSHQSN